MGIDADHTVYWKAEYSREKSREYVALDNTALCVKFVRVRTDVPIRSNVLGLIHLNIT